MITNRLSINNGQYGNINNLLKFGQAQANIFATSDNHGKFDSMPDMAETIQKHSDEIFPSSDILDIKNPESVKNIGIFNGDWFMDPAKGSYLTHPDKKAGDFQLLFLNKLIEQIKKPLKNFIALNAVGNHCLDGGDKYYVDLVTRKNNEFTTVLSNCNFEKSPIIQNLTPEQKEKIKSSYLLEIPDDKNENLKHKILVLGVVIMGVDFYNPGIVNGLDIIDRTDKKDSKIKEENIKQTYEVLNNIIQDFKKENPKGAVVLMSHTGNAISKMLASNVKDINLILNGHDHKDTQEIFKTPQGKEVPILSLGDDNKFFNSVHLNFDDDGNLKISYKKFDSEKSLESKNNELGRLLKECFSKDKEPYFYIRGNEGQVLSQKNIRKQNNLLANFATDGVLSSIKKYVPDVQIFGLASSAIRQDFVVGKKGNNNLELRNIFSGQTDDLSEVYVADVKGDNIVSMVIENLEDHLMDEDRNTIVQWSGLQIDKSGIKNVLSSVDTRFAPEETFVNTDPMATLALKPKLIAPYIKVKNDQGEYKPIDMEKIYKMALPNYFFKRPKLATAQKLENQYVPLNKTMDQLFREYLSDNNFVVNAPDPEDIRIK